VTKNTRTVLGWTTAAAVVVTLIFVGRDLYLRRHPVVNCPDSSHPTIDIRDFTTQHWAYSVKLEASIADKAKISTQLDPKVLTQMSEAFEEARELRKYVVAGYNNCAITQAQYAQFGPRFLALDKLAGEINTLLAKPSLSQEESTKLAGLIGQYGDLAKQLGSQ